MNIQHFYSKNGEKEEKKLARTAINNESKETRHQRNNIATTNNKKQWMNYENRLYRRDKNKHLTRNTSLKSNDTSVSSRQK